MARAEDPKGAGALNHHAATAYVHTKWQLAGYQARDYPFLRPISSCLFYYVSDATNQG